ncbi:putative protein tyrosine phosphatase [Rhodobium orientis]|uniref:Tyrosine protein phosphatase n=1 Tax=Rhodobium orientis TaxID=34017 RepID=A0A327JFK3_9HYPH|nr:tyrosine phosphatase family protein [Rhodobium orientis]MBB4303932.1 putative protein tyrosine phosphatase [Rhodobium orientis]MBK5951476.1 tyrosine protein phosphatase [Rhodobium orientis]RAI24546.1 tyrosine protein phosphatase [Rhodobium orientis]
MIHVCPLSRIDETVTRTGAKRLVTLINAGTPVPRPASIAPEDHLFLGFNDITDCQDGMTEPCEDHVREFLDFVGSWDRADPMVIHCWAGVSRSSAGAYVAACALNPKRDEAIIARRLRRASAKATPNALFVAIADQVLKREGRMTAAIQEIGRGAMAFENDPFELPID